MNQDISAHLYNIALLRRNVEGQPKLVGVRVNPYLESLRWRVKDVVLKRCRTLFS